MSADIWLEDEDGVHVTIDSDPDAELRAMVPTRSAGGHDSTTVNLTYNLSPMLWAAGMPRWKDMLHLRGAEAGPIWYKVACELRADPDRFRPYDAENGWGTLEDAQAAMDRLAMMCLAHPTAIVNGWL